MKSISTIAALGLAVLALVLAPLPAHAFGLSGVAAKVGGENPEHADGSVLVGGHLEFEKAGTRFHLQPGLMYWSSNGLSDVNPNLDVMYHFARPGRVSPYVGAGAGMHFYNNDNSDLGANLFGGFLIPSNAMRLFVEGRYVATDRSQTQITGGVTFPVGRTFGD